MHPLRRVGVRACSQFHLYQTSINSSGLRLRRGTGRGSEALQSPHLRQPQLQFQLRWKVSSTITQKQPLYHEWIIDGKISKDGKSHSEKPVVLFLHGLLGSGKNLRTLAKKFTKQTPGMRALLLDLRGHGQSNFMGQDHGHGHEPPHSITNCSMDVIHTAQYLNLVGDDSPVGIVGHSFGGRTALSYHHLTLTSSSHSQSQGSSVVLPPEQCWILDSCPGHAHSSVAEVIDAVSSIPMPVATKKDLVDMLLKQKISKAIAMWMTTNLQPVSSSGSGGTSSNGNGFEFMFDLNVAKGILKDFPEQDMIQQVRDCVMNTNNTNTRDVSFSSKNNKMRTIHKVIAGKNGSWTDGILNELQDIQKEGLKREDEDDHGYKLNILTLDAGHWVHIDALDSLLAAMTKEFQ